MNKMEETCFICGRKKAIILYDHYGHKICYNCFNEEMCLEEEEE
jgi:hypothetical protein